MPNCSGAANHLSLPAAKPLEISRHWREIVNHINLATGQSSTLTHLTTDDV
jgi:hypothetical protein